jgi:hypothetical protein
MHDGMRADTSLQLQLCGYSRDGGRDFSGGITPVVAM